MHLCGLHSFAGSSSSSPLLSAGQKAPSPLLWIQCPLTAQPLPCYPPWAPSPHQPSAAWHLRFPGGEHPHTSFLQDLSPHCEFQGLGSTSPGLCAKAAIQEKAELDPHISQVMFAF